MLKKMIDSLMQDYQPCIEDIKSRLQQVNKDISYVENALKNIPDVGVFRYALDKSHRIDKSWDTDCQEFIDFSGDRLVYVVKNDQKLTKQPVFQCKASIRFAFRDILETYLKIVLERLKEFSRTN